MGTGQNGSKPQRFPHLDALRVLAMLGVFIFHCGRAFDFEGWQVKNPVRANYFDWQTGLLTQWLMPLFFLISGWVTYTVLTRTNPGRFVSTRATRLLAPFVLGTLILVPPQVYVERVTQSGLRQDFLTWIPHYFDGFYAFGGNFAWMGLHLWYLAMLFLFSLLLLPVFLWLRRPVHYTFVSAWSAPLIAFLALVLVELVVNRYPDTWGLQSFGGWSPITYLVWFLIGHEIGRSAQFQAALVTWRWLALVIALVALAVGIALIGHRIPSIGYIGESVVRIGVAWGGIAAIMGFSARHLMRPNRVLSFANAYVLQFYVLHQTVIVLMVFLLLHWQVDPYSKFLTVLSASLVTVVVGLFAYNAAWGRLVAWLASRRTRSRQRA